MTKEKKPERVALILGGSGLVGGLVLQKVLDSGEYHQIFALVRKPLQLRHPLLIQRLVDFNRLESFSIDYMVDDLFCCLGTTMKQAGSRKQFRKVDLEYPLQMAHLLETQVQHFLVISSLGANKQSPFFYNQVKGEMEEALVACDFPFLTIVRPSLLLGARKDARLLEGLGGRLAKAIRPLLCGPLKKYAAIEAEQVAAALLAEAQKVAVNQRTQKNLILESDKMQSVLSF